MAVEVAKDAGSLKGDHRCDTAIVGAGIAGFRRPMSLPRLATVSLSSIAAQSQAV